MRFGNYVEVIFAVVECIFISYRLFCSLLICLQGKKKDRRSQQIELAYRPPALSASTVTSVHRGPSVPVVPDDHLPEVWPTQLEEKALDVLIRGRQTG